jgi:inositol polyphosphate 5-phosphatase INPP5E
MTLPKLLQKNSHTTTVQGSRDGTDHFDCVFWFGDFNFLINSDRDRVEMKVLDNRFRRSTNFDSIKNLDELHMCINQGDYYKATSLYFLRTLNYTFSFLFSFLDKAFRHFLEGYISFQPTYKFDINSDKYDTSGKLRIPSYCVTLLVYLKI